MKCVLSAPAHDTSTRYAHKHTRTHRSISLVRHISTPPPGVVTPKIRRTVCACVLLRIFNVQITERGWLRIILGFACCLSCVFVLFFWFIASSSLVLAVMLCCVYSTQFKHKRHSMLYLFTFSFLKKTGEISRRSRKQTRALEYVRAGCRHGVF